MKDHSFDARIVAAAPHSEHTNTFIKETMKQIKHTPLVGRLPSHHHNGFRYWLRHLSKPALALIAIVAVTLVSGAVYAAVHFAPAFLQLLGKETNQRGATEYSVAGFTECSTNNGSIIAPEKFEVTTDTTLSDEEVQKILQARCEMQWLQDFPGKKWPTYGTNAEWKDGDTIYYTRLDMIGTVANVTETNAAIVLGDRTVDHTPPQGTKITAFAAGEEIALDQLKTGDAVFTISRVSETYHDMRNYMSGPKDQPNASIEMPHSQPKVEGIVAVFKLSLPKEYYLEKQSYIVEIPECSGNEGELCPNTPSIDVYPRSGGEGATNPYRNNLTDGTHREISGEVVELGDDTLTLKSRTGNLYKVNVGDAGFAVYNRDYASAYTDVDATLKVGSRVAVQYVQPKDANPKTVTKDQVWRISLQLEGSNPKKNVRPY